jgi:hypothetical protein
MQQGANAAVAAESDDPGVELGERLWNVREGERDPVRRVRCSDVETIEQLKGICDVGGHIGVGV